MNYPTKNPKPVNQSGFTVIEIIIALGLLVVLGVVGYQAFQNSSQSDKTVIVSPTATPTKSTAVGNQLTITQFGVSMTLTAGLSGLSYKYVPAATNTDAAGKPYAASAYVNLISSQLKGQPSKCTGYDGSIASITSSTTAPTNQDSSPYSGALSKKIGANYYFLGLPNGGPCFDGALAQTEASQRTLIQQAFATLK